MSGKRKAWIAVVLGVLLLAGLGAWGLLRYIESKVTYRYLAESAGYAYGFYFLEKGKWPEDLPTALDYARSHAPKESPLFGVMRNPSAMAYLADMETCPGVEGELSADMGSWTGSDPRFVRLMERSRFATPVLMKSRGGGADDADRHAFTRNFYSGVMMVMIDAKEKEKEKEKSGGD